jgi:hypothetical protein
MYNDISGQLNEFKEGLNSGENTEIEVPETARRGGNVQDRINRMRSYMGGHRVRPQVYANGDNVAGDPPIITDEMLQQMIIAWDKGTQTSIHPSELPRTQNQFDQLDPKLKKIITGQYPDIKYLIHEGQPTKEEMMQFNQPQLGGQSMVPPNIQSQNPGGFENLVNMQSRNPDVMQQMMGSPRSYENGDVTEGTTDPTNPLYTSPSGTVSIGKSPDGSMISSNWNPKINMGYASNYGDDASDLTKLGNLQAGLKLGLGDRTNIGTTFGYTQPLGTSGGLRNTIASANVGMGLRPGVKSFYADDSRQAEAYGDLNLGLGRYGSFKGGLPWGVKGSLNLGSEHSMQPGVSGQLDANLGLLRGFGGYNSQTGGYGGLGFSLPLGRRENNEMRRIVNRKTGGTVPSSYEQGAEVEMDPTLNGIGEDDLTMINRQSGEVVRRNYPGTSDTDTENYYEYTGTTHSNVRSGMPNGGNNVQEQVGAFIFPKKHATEIKKIVRDRKYYQDIINQS